MEILLNRTLLPILALLPLLAFAYLPALQRDKRNAFIIVQHPLVVNARRDVMRPMRDGFILFFRHTLYEVRKNVRRRCRAHQERQTKISNNGGPEGEQTSVVA